MSPLRILATAHIRLAAPVEAKLPRSTQPALVIRARAAEDMSLIKAAVRSRSRVVVGAADVGGGEAGLRLRATIERTRGRNRQQTAGRTPLLKIRVPKV